MTIAFQRYLAVCQPFKHNEFTIRKILPFYVLIYFQAAFFNSTAAFEVSYFQFFIFYKIVQKLRLSFLHVDTPALTSGFIYNKKVWAT